MSQTIMQYSGLTGELVCFAPAGGEEVLRIVEPDMNKANAISAAVQEAYRKGSILGRLSLQLEIERLMDDRNRA